jgi:hypothetical protein
MSSETDFTLISTEAESQHIVRTFVVGLPQITVDLEGDLTATGHMSLLTIEAISRVFLFDVFVCPAILHDAALVDVLQGSDTVKVMHASICPESVVDLTLASDIKSMRDCGRTLLTSLHPPHPHPSPPFSQLMHDCRHDSEALAGQFGITLANVFDTQANSIPYAEWVGHSGAASPQHHRAITICKRNSTTFHSYFRSFLSIHILFTRFFLCDYALS